MVMITLLILYIISVLCTKYAYHVLTKKITKVTSKYNDLKNLKKEDLKVDLEIEKMKTVIITYFPIMNILFTISIIVILFMNDSDIERLIMKQIDNIIDTNK